MSPSTATVVSATTAASATTTILLSNNGVDFSEVAGSFTYNNDIPDVLHVYTIQEAGSYKAGRCRLTPS